MEDRELKNIDGNVDEKWEETLEEKLRRSADDVKIPVTLEPKTVTEILRKRRKERLRKYAVRFAGAAAAACVCIAVGISSGYLNYGEDTEGGRVASSETDAASSSSAGTSGTAGQGQTEETGAAADSGKIAAASDYEEIYEYIQEQQKQYETQAEVYSDGTMDGASASSGAGNGGAVREESASDSAGSGQTDTGSYSDTNVREQGVGEADAVKTDGQNLYIQNGQKVSIVGIGTEEMEALSEIRLEDDCYISEIYVEEGKLVVLYTRSEYNEGDEGYGYYTDYTCADVYDVSSPAEPEKITTVSQSGYYDTMRAKDGYIYILSRFYADAAAPRSGISAYVPEAGGDLIAAENIYMPQGRMGSEYTVITSFSLENPEERTDSKAVFGTGGICYVSSENIYITESLYGENDADVTQTSIRKVSYSDGILEGVAQTKIDGTLNDSFSIDEYEGYLRLVTTVTPVNNNVGIQPFYSLDDSTSSDTAEAVDTNSLYVLDENLEITGEIRNMAPDERVYSARFMGETGYFVTFKETDPLFSADLSDPANPDIIGSLKIPGFSEYLHPYGDGRLLGIGMDVDEEMVTTDGVKLSMFDISDPSDVKELSMYILEDTYSTDVAYNYKAVFVDVEKNLFGFMAYGNTPVYHVFSFDEENGFQEVFSREMPGYGDVRGLYSGDRFYLVTGNTVEAYTLSDFRKIDDIVL